MRSWDRDVTPCERAAREQSDRDENSGCGGRHRVSSLDTEQQRTDERRHPEAQGDADRGTGQHQRGDTPEHEPHDTTRARTERRANRDLRPPPPGRVRGNTVDAERREQYRQASEEAGHRGNEPLLNRRGAQLIAVVAEGERSRPSGTAARIFCSP